MTKKRTRSFQQIGFEPLKNLLNNFDNDRDKYISQEFQKYGYDLACELNDLKNKSLYIKLAKETPRGLLESARNYVKDAYEVKNPAALFLWKLKQLKVEKDDFITKKLKDGKTEKLKYKKT